MTRLVPLFLLVTAACGSAPTLQTECTADDDCALVTTEDRDGTCCSICGSEAATKASAEAHRAWCNEHPGHADHCPRLDCPHTRDSAACEAGRCVVHSEQP